MEAKKCDRCGRFYGYTDGIVLSYGDAKDEFRLVPKKYDLCEECSVAFERWFNQEE